MIYILPFLSCLDVIETQTVCISQYHGYAAFLTAYCSFWGLIATNIINNINNNIFILFKQEIRKYLDKL